MDKKIFEKKMRSKYIITAVSFLVATLFIGTAMTSAVAGSVDKSQSSSTSSKSQPSSTSGATGCPLCGNSEGKNGVAAQLPGGGGPSTECDIKVMAQIAITIASGLWNIVRNIDLQKVKAFMKQGFNITKAIGLVVSNFIQTHSEELATLVAIAIYGSILFLQSNFTQKAFAAIVLLIPGILTTLFTIGVNLLKDGINLLLNKDFRKAMLKFMVDIVSYAIFKLCKLCNPDLNPDPPQGPTSYTEPTSVPSASQSIAQSTMQTAALSTQSFSVSSLRSSSVISQIGVVPSAQQSSASSSQSPSVVIQTTAAPSTQQSSASSSLSSSVISQTAVAPTQQSSVSSSQSSASSSLSSSVISRLLSPNLQNSLLQQQ